jgi:hypothetical protein
MAGEATSPAPWNVDLAHCWVWPSYFCRDSCPFRHGGRSLFALTAPDRPSCALSVVDKGDSP